MRLIARLACVAVLGAWLCACPSSSVSVAISPASTTVMAGGSQTFTATVTGSSNTAVTWTVTEATGGTITSGGTYTAPSATGTFHVVATSAADTSKSATATVTVTAAAVVSVSISPTAATLNPGGMQTFTATVSGSSNTSVTWSVQEGAGGGTVTAGGVYTAPSVIGTYHVIATSAADTTKSATAVVTVQNAPVISVTVNPPTAQVGPLESQAFTATVMNTANTSVTWSVQEGDGGTVTDGGLYTAPTAAGTYHVVATSEADTTKSGSATVTVTALPTGTTVSGTVSYGGTKGGRIYIGLYDPNCSQCDPYAGTSLPDAGAYTLRVGQASGTFVVQAFMDTAGIQSPLPTTDPAGTTSQLTVSGTSLSGINLALADPSPPTPTAPGMPGGFLSNDGAVLGWNNPTTATDHANVYAVQATGGTVCPVNTSTVGWGTPRSVPIRQNSGGPQALLHGLVQNGTYCFAVSGVANATEGPLSPVWGPVQVVAPSGGHSVSGTVSFGNLTPTGPLYVALVNNPNSSSPTIFFTDFGSPTSPQAFTITGVPSGTYGLYAFIDMHNAGAFVPGMVGNTDTQYPQSVTVGASNADAGSLVLPVGDVLTSALTQGYSGQLPDGGAGLVYNLQVGVQSDVALPVAVTLTAGPHLSSVLDVGLSPNAGGGSSSRFQTNVGLNGVTPTVGDTYSFTITLSDGTQENLGATVSGVVPGVATLTTPPPNGTAASDTPTFMWTLPVGVNSSSYVQQIQVGPASGGNSIWQLRNMPTSQTSLLYDVDSTASLASLSSGQMYSWGLQIQDLNGNSTQANASFTAP